MRAARVAPSPLAALRPVAALVLIVAFDLAAPAPAVRSGACAAAESDAAPADAWPLARGCAAGTGVSAAALRLPLDERWRRRS